MYWERWCQFARWLGNKENAYQLRITDEDAIHCALLISSTCFMATSLLPAASLACNTAQPLSPLHICTFALYMCVHIYAYAYATVHYATVHCAKKPLHLLTSSCLRHPCLIVWKKGLILVWQKISKRETSFQAEKRRDKINDMTWCQDQYWLLFWSSYHSSHHFHVTYISIISYHFHVTYISRIPHQEKLQF